MTTVHGARLCEPQHIVKSERLGNYCDCLTVKPLRVALPALRKNPYPTKLDIIQQMRDFSIT
jgi:hypothetical protein